MPPKGRRTWRDFDPNPDETPEVTMIRIDFAAPAEDPTTPVHGLARWHDALIEAFRASEGLGAPIFRGPGEIVQAADSPTGVYTEVYSDFDLELDDDGTTSARLYSTSEYGTQVLRIAAGGLGLTVVDLDTASSASRQHFIDTGRYLAAGESEEW